jgi:hypothetical protein
LDKISIDIGENKFEPKKHKCKYAN